MSKHQRQSDEILFTESIRCESRKNIDPPIEVDTNHFWKRWDRASQKNETLASDMELSNFWSSFDHQTTIDSLQERIAAFPQGSQDNLPSFVITNDIQGLKSASIKINDKNQEYSFSNVISSSSIDSIPIKFVVADYSYWTTSQIYDLCNEQSPMEILEGYIGAGLLNNQKFKQLLFLGELTLPTARIEFSHDLNDPFQLDTDFIESDTQVISYQRKTLLSIYQPIVASQIASKRKNSFITLPGRSEYNDRNPFEVLEQALDALSKTVPQGGAWSASLGGRISGKRVTGQLKVDINKSGKLERINQPYWEIRMLLDRTKQIDDEYPGLDIGIKLLEGIFWKDFLQGKNVYFNEMLAPGISANHGSSWTRPVIYVDPLSGSVKTAWDYILNHWNSRDQWRAASMGADMPTFSEAMFNQIIYHPVKVQGLFTFDISQNKWIHAQQIPMANLFWDGRHNPKTKDVLSWLIAQQEQSETYTFKKHPFSTPSISLHGLSSGLPRSVPASASRIINQYLAKKYGTSKEIMEFYYRGVSRSGSKIKDSLLEDYFHPVQLVEMLAQEETIHSIKTKLTSLHSFDEQAEIFNRFNTEIQNKYYLSSDLQTIRTWWQSGYESFWAHRSSDVYIGIRANNKFLIPRMVLETTVSADFICDSGFDRGAGFTHHVAYFRGQKVLVPQDIYGAGIIGATETFDPLMNHKPGANYPGWIDARAEIVSQYAVPWEAKFGRKKNTISDNPIIYGTIFGQDAGKMEMAEWAGRLSDLAYRLSKPSDLFTQIECGGASVVIINKHLERQFIKQQISTRSSIIYKNDAFLPVFTPDEYNSYWNAILCAKLLSLFDPYFFKFDSRLDFLLYLKDLGHQRPDLLAWNFDLDLKMLESIFIQYGIDYSASVRGSIVYLSSAAMFWHIHRYGASTHFTTKSLNGISTILNQQAFINFYSLQMMLGISGAKDFLDHLTTISSSNFTNWDTSGSYLDDPIYGNWKVNLDRRNFPR